MENMFGRIFAQIFFGQNFLWSEYIFGQSRIFGGNFLVGKQMLARKKLWPEKNFSRKCFLVGKVLIGRIFYQKNVLVGIFFC